MQNFDVVVLSNDKIFQKRIESLAQGFKYQMVLFENAEKFLDNYQTIGNPEFIAVDGRLIAIDGTTGMIQLAKQLFPTAPIMVVLGSKTNPENTQFMKTSGASAVLLETEFLTTSKAEFICSQAVRAQYLSIRGEDLKEGSKIDCNLLHYMQLNRKYLPVAQAGQEISKEKLDKIKSVSEVYFDKKHLAQVNQYIASHQGQGELSVEAKCRNLFLNLGVAFSDLVLSLSDQSGSVSFAEGKVLYEKTENFVNEIVKLLSLVSDPWALLYDLKMGQYGIIDRSPIVAGMAGLLSMKAEVGNPQDAMFSALMSDIGMIELSSGATFKLRAKKTDDLTSEERVEYEKHPIFSLNQLLTRKLQLSENIKNIIVSTHERADLSGFPYKPRAEKIPDEALLIQFCEIFDRDYVNLPVKGRPALTEQKKKHLDQQFMRSGLIGEHFLRRIRNPFLGIT